MNCIKNERIKNEIIKNERIKNKRIKNELIKKRTDPVTQSYRIYSKSNCCVLKHSVFWCLDFITDDDKVWLFGMIYSFKKSSSSAASVRDNFHFQKIAGCKFVGNLHSFMLHQRTITKTKIRN